MGCGAIKQAAIAAQSKDERPPKPPLSYVIDQRKTAEENTSLLIAIACEHYASMTPNEFDALCSQFTHPEALFSAIEAGDGKACTVLRASWLKRQSVKGGFRLPKRGTKLPAVAIISVAELRRIHRASKGVAGRPGQRRCAFGALPVIALSHYWRTKEHPDPDGETADLLITALKQRWADFQAKGVSDLGVLIDWCALPQQPRETEEEERLFIAGLRGINQWYAHAGSTVFAVTAGQDRVDGRTYWQKGWCSFEHALAMMIKPSNMTDFKDWPQFLDLGQPAPPDFTKRNNLGNVVGDEQTQTNRPSVAEPLSFFADHANGNKTYTNGADRDTIVAPKFMETSLAVWGGARVLDFGHVRSWGISEAKALSVVLPLAVSMTKLAFSFAAFGDEGFAAIAPRLVGLRELRELWAQGISITSEGAKALVSAVQTNGALPKLELLSLHSNQITDEGMAALASAIRGGALPSLKTIHLHHNPGSDKSVQQSLQQRLKSG